MRLLLTCSLLLAWSFWFSNLSLAQDNRTLKICLDSDQNAVERVKACRIAAAHGNATAQAVLGVMYSGGEGVPKDDTEAAAWLWCAAEQDFAVAQFLLGLMYGQGEGVPQDFVQAHMWLTLAGERGNVYARRILDLTLEAWMTWEEIAKAEKLAREWTPKAWEQIREGSTGLMES